MIDVFGIQPGGNEVVCKRRAEFPVSRVMKYFPDGICQLEKPVIIQLIQLRVCANAGQHILHIPVIHIHFRPDDVFSLGRSGMMAILTVLFFAKEKEMQESLNQRKRGNTNLRLFRRLFHGLVVCVAGVRREVFSAVSGDGIGYHTCAGTSSRGSITGICWFRRGGQLPAFTVFSQFVTLTKCGIKNPLRRHVINNQMIHANRFKEVASSEPRLFHGQRREYINFIPIVAVKPDSPGPRDTFRHRTFFGMKNQLSNIFHLSVLRA
ncbi:hypothetical protein CC794_11650 [Salmonella enterica subsp. enterica serovar Panama]|nr:hypothetical protein [Salmonella enterica subsp. enterica serovar Panama]